MTKNFSVFACLLFFVCASCSPTDLKPVNANSANFVSRPSEFSLSVARALAYTYEDYKKFEVVKDCIRVSPSYNNDKIVVSIYSKLADENDDVEQITVVSGQGNRCGPQFNYEFDADGNFIARTGVR